jgi:hypothetical protein
VETPEAPREGRARLAHELSLLALGAAAASFVSLFMPWFGFVGRNQAGWDAPLGSSYGLLALAVVLVELLFLARAWASKGSGVVAFCLTAAAGLIGLSAFVNLRFGNLVPNGFSVFGYGAWLGFVFAVMLILVAALRLAGLWQSAP